MNTIPKLPFVSKKMLYIIGIPLSIILAVTLVYWGANGGLNGQNNTVPVVAEKPSGFDTITIAVAGDLMCHSTQFNAVKKGDGFDFVPVFAGVTPYISTADLSFANLETVTAGESEKFTGYPQFNTPAAYLDGLKAAGFDVITTANNHSLDRRYLGVTRTLDSLDARQFQYTGTYRDAADTNNVLMAERKGVRIAVLAYTFSTNGIPLPVGKEFCVSMMDSARMRRDVERAKTIGADKIAVFIHWGNEYERQPAKKQKDYAHYLANLGVDLIFGSHPHVIQPTEIIQTPQKPVFVIYSLGNFVSGQRKPFTDYGVIVRVQLIKNRSTGETKTGRIDYIPTYVSADQQYRIIPIPDALQAVDQNTADAANFLSKDITRMREIWPEVTKHLTDEKVGITPYQPSK
jgi:poly-gamma-glutamate capsule biosynthesis protein CapA/YwtB (metallophosphatase superfamily)